MMKKLIMTGIAMMTIAIFSCSEDTTTVGNTLTNDVDKFVITSDTFNISTRSIVADSVLSRSSYSYLGRMKDPETGSYISANYSTQFSVLEDEDYFIDKDSLLSFDEDGNVLADSCFINLIIQSYTGDSLAAMKMTMTEMAKPIQENQFYYTNFDPAAKDYLRKDGIVKKKMYSISDLTLSDSIRNLRRNGSLYETIRIPLNDPYTDKNGITYNNYGTYIMRKFYEHPEYFKGSQVFARNVCPGFYFQTVDGLGQIAEILYTQIEVNYHYKLDSLIVFDQESFNGTEEVLQTNLFSSDSENIKRLAANESHTYLKAPEGIFTEITLPIEEIKFGHETDTIASAKIVFRRMNDTSDLSDIILQEPQNLLMITRDSLYSFFEERNLPNNKTSYLATYSSSKNSYTFSNISGLINHMYARRGKDANWNKAVLVPVQVTTTSASASSSTTTVASVNNELRMTSVRLVGGSKNQHEPVRISIVYNKNNK
ncbi:MAG: DUF4270 domain-containing protein [Prevotella sp.]|nr:DUF4270 domain-containing protein [Prevotella sp.]